MPNVIAGKSATTGLYEEFLSNAGRMQVAVTAGSLQILTDTTTALTALNSTAALACEGCKYFDLILTLGTAATPPTIQLQGSEDGTTGWRDEGVTLQGTASSTVSIQISGILPAYVRATVKVVGVTLGAGFSIKIKAGV